MPNRVIREGILDSERFDKIADDAAVEVFYRRLHSVVDDFGRFSAHTRIIRAACYPLRLDAITESTIQSYLARCERAGLLILYVASGKRFLELCDFGQRLRVMKSRYPDPRSADNGQQSAVGCPTGDGQAPDICRRESESETKRNEEERESDAEKPPPLPDDSFRLDDGFEELWAAYPAKGQIKRPMAEQAYADVMLPAIDRRVLHDQIVAAVHGPWAASDTWSKGIIAGLDRFLREQRWRENPEPAKGPVDEFAEALRLTKK